jgi:hypothetical protein
MALLGPIMMRAVAGNVLSAGMLPPFDGRAHVATFLAGHGAPTGVSDDHSPA